MWGFKILDMIDDYSKLHKQHDNLLTMYDNLKKKYDKLIHSREYKAYQRSEFKKQYAKLKEYLLRNRKHIEVIRSGIYLQIKCKDLYLQKTFSDNYSKAHCEGFFKLKDFDDSIAEDLFTIAWTISEV